MRGIYIIMESYEELWASSLERVLLSCIHGNAEALCDMQWP
jgi:hypothetical protein